MRLLVQIGLGALGSAVGGLTRWGVGTAVGRWLGTTFPWGTFLKIQGLPPFLDEVVTEGLITIEAVRILRYRHNRPTLG